MDIACVACGVTKEAKQGKDGPKLPKTWKRTGQTYCQSCWKKHYVLRCISIPVKGPTCGATWTELREALNRGWHLAQAACNVAMSTLYARDVVRDEAATKMPKHPNTYVYPDVRRAVPSLPSGTASAIAQEQTLKYTAKRYDVVWTGAASLPSARFPQPYPIRKQEWKATYETAGKDGGDMVPCVHVPLPGGRFVLQLKGGREFHRQLRAFAQFVDGTAERGSLSICRQRIGSAGGRKSLPGRDGGGQRIQTRVMVKMVGWFPRQAPLDRKDTLFIRTTATSMLLALDTKQNKIREWHGQHVKRWMAEHRKHLQQFSDDRKAEQRPKASFQSRLEAQCHKHHNRIESAIKELAAQVAGVAKRMKFAVVQFDGSDTSYFGDGRFEWAAFRARLKTKLDEIGVTLEIAERKGTSQ